MMNKAQATQAIKNGATLAIHTETRKAYLYINNECHTVRIDTAERIACEMAVDLRYYLTWGEDGDRVEEYEAELSLEQEEAVERGLTREQALQGGGAFGLVACIDSVAFEVETLGKDARELLAQFEERAQRDPFFNRSMITACRAYIEAHPTQAQEEEQPAQAEELTAFVVSFVKNDVPQARVIMAEDEDEARDYFEWLEPTANVCGVELDRVGLSRRGCPVEVVPPTFFDEKYAWYLEDFRETVNDAEELEDLEPYRDELKLIRHRKARALCREMVETRAEEIKNRKTTAEALTEAMYKLSDLFAQGGNFSARFHFWEDLGGFAYEYFTEGNDYDSAPMSWDMVEDWLSCLDPVEAFNRGYFTAEGFSMNDDIFSFNGYGNLQSFGSWHGFFEREVDFESFAEFMETEHEDEARELLEEYADELSR